MKFSEKTIYFALILLVSLSVFAVFGKADEPQVSTDLSLLTGYNTETPKIGEEFVLSIDVINKTAEGASFNNVGVIVSC